MADENNANEKNGKVGLVERVKEDIQSLKTDIPTKAKEQIEGLKDPTKTQVYTSIFRHKHDDTPRNRALGVLSNVFLHLHPANSALPRRELTADFSSCIIYKAYAKLLSHVVAERLLY